MPNRLNARRRALFYLEASKNYPAPREVIVTVNPLKSFFPKVDTLHPTTIMKVKNVMRGEVITVQPETSYEEAVKIMHRYNFSGLPVINGKGKLVGMISEKDLFRALYPNYQDFILDPTGFRDQETQEENIDLIRNHPVEKYMNRKVLTIEPEAAILRAGGLMLSHGIHRLPVVLDGKLVGIVTREEIYTAILKKRLGF